MSRVNSLAASVMLTGLPRRARSAQAFGVTIGRLGDRRSEPRNHATVKCRLQHAALAVPVLAVAGHDLMAEQDRDLVSAPPP